MKKTYYHINMKHLIILLLLTCLSSCMNNDPISDFNCPVEYDIPNGPHLSDHNGEILLINNDWELKAVFAEDYTLLKPVDFHNYRILIIKGHSPYGIESIDHELHDNNLTINISQTIATVVEPWTVAYIIPRDINPADIKISINYTNDKDII